MIRLATHPVDVWLSHKGGPRCPWCRAVVDHDRMRGPGYRESHSLLRALPLTLRKRSKRRTPWIEQKGRIQ